MKFSIYSKLLFSFLGLTLLILVATLGLARWSFERGFLDYINTQEQIRLQPLAKKLALSYKYADHSWKSIDNRLFKNLLRSIEESRFEGRARSPLRPKSDNDKSGPPDRGRPPPPPQKSPPTALYDSENTLIAGVELPNQGKLIRIPIVLDDKIIGEVRSSPQQDFNSPQEAAFSRQQLMTSALIGFGSLCLAAIVAGFLTRLTLKPIKQLASGMSELSKGKYDTRLNTKRSDELGTLMADLDELARILEKNRESRKRWLADISHELRTPVTIITGEIETMKDGIRPLDMKQVHSFDEEVSRLRLLIDDLYELSISDIGGLRYAFKEHDLIETINSSINGIHERAKQKGITLKIQTPEQCLISADGLRLAQLFKNLLENSLNYTDAPGIIRLNVIPHKNGVNITIDDSAPGAEKSECEQLFEPLYRQETSRNRRHSGAGLGLAICKNIIEAHRGKIHASPSTHGGICMDITLPIHHNQPSE